MGTFLAFSGVIGKSKNEVLTSLTNYAKSVSGGIEKQQLTTNDDNCCVIDEANGNTSILYPNHYLEWDDSSRFMSKDLKAPVFSFHIHDGDLWMYILYFDGEIIDQFNPIPDYWEEEISEEEIESWKGNASTLAKHIPNLQTKNIEKYLVRWDLENEEQLKAYPDDEFTNEDWQLVDFMKKIGLSYPLDDDGNSNGETFKLWTKQLRIKNNNQRKTDNLTTLSKPENSSKPWWKFW
jgi:hypothetical protein